MKHLILFLSIFCITWSLKAQPSKAFSPDGFNVPTKFSSALSKLTFVPMTLSQYSSQLAKLKDGQNTLAYVDGEEWFEYRIAAKSGNILSEFYARDGEPDSLSFRKVDTTGHPTEKTIFHYDGRIIFCERSGNHVPKDCEPAITVSYVFKNLLIEGW